MKPKVLGEVLKAEKHALRSLSSFWCVEKLKFSTEVNNKNQPSEAKCQKASF